MVVLEVIKSVVATLNLFKVFGGRIADILQIFPFYSSSFYGPVKMFCCILEILSLFIDLPLLN